MKAPSCSSKITKEWVQYIVEEHLKKQHQSNIPVVNIKDFSVNKGTTEGDDGLSSELVTLDISASLKEWHGVTETTLSDVKYHFVVKFLSPNFINKEINKRMKSTIREYAIYTEIIRDLNYFQSSIVSDQLRIHIPELVYGKCSENEFVLVMENLKECGYENNDKHKGLSYIQLKEAVNQLARVHALSYVYNKTHDFLEKYPYFQFNESTINIPGVMIDVCIDNGVSLLRSKKDKEQLVNKIEANKERLLTSLVPLIRVNNDAPSCMIHGDYWNNNLMYRYKEEENPEQDEAKLECKIVDWGNSGWGSPVLDLQYLIYTSTTLETRKKYLESILQHYHSTFIDATTKLGTPTLNWNYVNFQKEWQRLSSYGILMGLMTAQLNLSKFNPAHKTREQSVLDHPLCLPTKFLVDGMLSCMANVVVSLILKPSGFKSFRSRIKKVYIPLTEEILSGNNEVLNKRILDLLCEADDKGIFDV